MRIIFLFIFVCAIVFDRDIRSNKYVSKSREEERDWVLFASTSESTVKEEDKTLGFFLPSWANILAFYPGWHARYIGFSSFPSRISKDRKWHISNLDVSILASRGWSLGRMGFFHIIHICIELVYKLILTEIMWE